MGELAVPSSAKHTRLFWSALQVEHITEIRIFK